jgi:predicted lactoylglutathione lyase
MLNSIFVNLPVVSLKKSVDFFTQLGFKFNPQFTDETSTCMIVSETIYVMLVEHAKFSAFIDKPIAASNTTEAIFGFACESKDEVLTLAGKAIELGARKVNEPVDMGFMFSWGFEDLDGHLWDLFWMDTEHIQG